MIILILVQIRHLRNKFTFIMLYLCLSWTFEEKKIVPVPIQYHSNKNPFKCLWSSEFGEAINLLNSNRHIKYSIQFSVCRHLMRTECYCFTLFVDRQSTTVDKMLLDQLIDCYYVCCIVSIAIQCLDIQVSFFIWMEISSKCCTIEQ